MMMITAATTNNTDNHKDNHNSDNDDHKDSHQDSRKKKHEAFFFGLIISSQRIEYCKNVIHLFTNDNTYHFCTLSQFNHCVVQNKSIKRKCMTVNYSWWQPIIIDDVWLHVMTFDGVFFSFLSLSCTWPSCCNYQWFHHRNNQLFIIHEILIPCNNNELLAYCT